MSFAAACPGKRGTAAWPAVLLCLAGPVGAWEVVATPANGAGLRGRLVLISVSGLTIETGTGVVRLSSDRLPVVAPASRSRLRADTAQPPETARIWLRDGSTLPAREVLAGDDAETIRARLAIPSAGGGSVALPLEAIHCIRFSGQGREHDAQWRAMRVRPTADDLIVPRPEPGAPLDYLPGFIEAIGGESVRLRIDGESMDAPRNRLYGLVLGGGQAGTTAGGPLVCMSRGTALRAKSLRLAGEHLKVVFGPGLATSVPLGSVASIDYTAGRLQNLGEIPPVETETRPLFGVPKAVTKGPGWPAFRADAGFWGGPLDVHRPGGVPRRFRHGLAIRTGGEVAYKTGGARRLQAVVGFPPAASPDAVARLRIEGDAGVIADVVRRYGDRPLAVDLPIATETSFRLRVDRVDGPDTTLHLGDARLVR